MRDYLDNHLPTVGGVPKPSLEWVAASNVSGSPRPCFPDTGSTLRLALAVRSPGSSTVRLGMPDDDDRRDRTTTVLDPRTITSSWPIVLATLEQIGPWTIFAMRLGTLALLRDCIQRMAAEDASASLVNEAQTLLDALRRMPFDRK